MDKRKGIILAVVIILLIGLGTFVFANPSERLDENDNNTNNPSDVKDDENLDNENTNDGSGEEGEEEDKPNDSNGDETNGNRNEGNGSIADNPKDEDSTEVVIGDDEENKPSNPSEEDKPDEDLPSEEETDKSAPIVTILDKTYQGLDNKIGFVGTDVVLSLVEENLVVSITLNDEALEFSNGMVLSSDGNYRLSVKDDAGNETVVEFSLDKTAPKFNIASGTHSDEDINIKVEDASLAYITIYNQDKGTTETKEGTNEFTLSEEATYKITAYDELGNETTIWVAIDKTDPKIEVTGTGNQNYYRDDATLTVFDKFLTKVTVNGEEFTEDAFTSTGNNENRTFTKVFSEEGTYEVIATDKFGNTDEFTFYVDKTAPKISGLDAGYEVNKNEIITISDENLASVTIN